MPRLAPSSLNCTEAIPMVEVAFAWMVSEPETVPPEGVVILITGGGFDTVTVTPAEVAVWFRLSVTTAVKVCDPFVVVVEAHCVEAVYVDPDPETAVPRFTLSSLNCTEATLAVGEAALALMVIVPTTEAPAAGLVMLMVGGGLLTVIVIAAEVVLWPRLSVAIARKACEPVVSVAVFSWMLNGPEPVWRAPKFAPSTWNCTEATGAFVCVVVAARVMVPVAAPPVGDVILTFGPPLETVTVTETVFVWPIVSVAIAVNVCEPLTTPLVFHCTA